MSGDTKIELVGNSVDVGTVATPVDATVATIRRTATRHVREDADCCVEVRGFLREVVGFQPS